MTDPLILAAQDSIAARLAFSALFLLFGVAFIIGGRRNIRTRTAEETGQRRIVNALLKRANIYEGSLAVAIGWMRIITGIFAIAAAIFFLVSGPADQPPG